MVKTGVFKKIAALTAALAIVGSFAVSASAVTVSTTTTYAEEGKVSVSVDVSGFDAAGIEVTYYATNGETDVYVNQDATDAEGKAEFDYVTEEANLKSTVLVGYTGSTDAESALVDARTISVVGGDFIVVPTEDAEDTFVIPYTLPESTKLTGVTAVGAEVVAEMVAGGIQVTLTDVTGDVTITPVYDNVIVENVICENTAGAVVIADGTTSYVGAAEGQGFITVLADIDGLAEGREFGVIISDAAITAGTFDAIPDGAKAYRAKAKGADGKFGVRVVDTATEEADKFIKADSTYYTAVYYVNAKGKYVIAAVETVE